MTILVTGATGTVGGQLLNQLPADNVRVLVRDPAKAALPDGVDVVRGDLSDPASLDTAVKDVDSVFLVFPTLQADQVAPEVIDALTRHAPHIVYLSAAAVADEHDGTGIVGSHARLEHLIEESGAEWTFVRPTGFAKNALMWADQIRAGDVVRWFHGAATRSLIHEHDIAAVAARALTTNGHVGARYHVTGPEQLTLVEQVHAIGEAIGRPLRFDELAPEDAVRELFPDSPFAKSIVDGHAKMVRNPEPVTSTVLDITGTQARTFAQWAADHAADFTRW
ncbi:MAG TPA: NAD(P)H-binding protein [Pseudonocardiaceae bacterium]|jgi:uncharacterized protein YbjT (DUF2867 family)